MSDIESKLQELELRIAVLERENTKLLDRLLVTESAIGRDKTKLEKMKPVAERPVPQTHEPVIPEYERIELIKPTPPGPKKADSVLRPLQGKLKTKKAPDSGLAAELMEAKIGGTWLNRIGIVAFVFGLGFFLKYSFDNNWIGPTGRVVIGILAGLLLLAGGEAGQKKGYRTFSQGLTGGGVAALYFAIFAAFSLYHLIGQITAFGIMILITSTAVLLAVRYNAYAIAILGIIGGFLTPFFLSTGVLNEIGLFSYIALLNCGILGLAYFKQWRSLNIISFAFTLLIVAIWVISPDSSKPVWTNQVFYTIFFVIFACLSIFYNVVHRVRTKSDDLILITANAVAFFLISYNNLVLDYDRYIGFLPFGMALIYFVIGYLAWQRNREDRFLVLSLWGIAVVFLTITMPIQLHGKWITVAWAVEAAVLLWVGCINKSIATRKASLAVLVIALLRLLLDAQVYTYFYKDETFWPVLNLHMIPFAASISCVFIMAYVYHRNLSILKETEKVLWQWFLVLGTGLTAAYLSLEAFRFCSQWGIKLFGNNFRYEETQALSVAIIWFAECIVLVWLGRRNRFFWSQLLGLLSFLIGGLLLFGPGAEIYLHPNTGLWPILTLRSMPYLMGIIAALFVGKRFICGEDPDNFWRYVPVGAAVVANLVALAYLSLEVVGFYNAWWEQLGLGANLSNAIQMTLSVVWTLYAIALMVAGFIWQSRPPRLMSIVIFAGTILKVFLFDLANLDTIYRIISFIVLGGLLVVVSFLYQRYKDRIFGLETGPPEEDDS